MAILNFQKPDKIVLQKATDFEGTIGIPSFRARIWRYRG